MHDLLLQVAAVVSATFAHRIAMRRRVSGLDWPSPIHHRAPSECTVEPRIQEGTPVLVSS